MERSFVPELVDRQVGVGAGAIRREGHEAAGADDARNVALERGNVLVLVPGVEGGFLVGLAVI